jgi:hypothetical protein
MFSTSQLLLALIFGAAGLGFLTYGRKQKAPVPLLVGVALLIFPYFIVNPYLMAIIGIALIIIPYFIRI